MDGAPRIEGAYCISADNVSSMLLRLPGSTRVDAPGYPADITIRLDDVPRLLRGRKAGVGRLIVAGAPPREEVGYGFVPVLAAALRPTVVTIHDETTDHTVDSGLGGFLGRTTAPALAQLTISAAAIGAQWLAVRALDRVPRKAKARRGGLRRMLYVRPGARGSRTGGSVTHTHEVIRAARGLGITVDALTTDEAIARTAAEHADPPCEWTVRRVPVVARGFPASVAFGGDMILLATAVRRARAADVIYQRHGRFVLSGALLALASGTPLFLEYNGSEAYFQTHWQRTPFRRQLARAEDVVLRLAARVIVVSEVDRMALIERGIDADRIVLNPNGVDASRFGGGGGSDVRANHGFTENDLVVGFVGSFGPWHGAPRLAEAFARVAHELPNARLLLVGDGAERPTTEEILRRAGVEHRVVATGSVLPSRVPALLDACDILTAPHVRIPGGVEFFGSPTKLFEYMAAGKAIVASSLGQIADVLDDGRTAVLVEPGDDAGLAGAIVRLAGDASLRRRLGEAARSDAVERHSWDLNARRLVEAYAAL